MRLSRPMPLATSWTFAPTASHRSAISLIKVILVARKALEIGPIHQETMAKAYKKGVPMGFGTDAGVFPHGKNAIEFGYLLEAGIPLSESLKAATITNAKLLDMADSLGQLKEGFLADIVAVDEDPTKNAKTLETVAFVMKDGVVYKQ